MKKIININLSGRVIPIEDAAYERLQNYIESLRRYFANEDGRDEIINDIESRIAELMDDKVKKGATAVTEADVEEIITAMGRIEDFEAASETIGAEETTGTYSESSTKQRFKGRLYRDGRDKILGGVCAGIANYTNVDPAVVRLLFAIITLGGFGFGFLIYILLWIILPVRNLETYTGKRFYRNPDERIIGGVAGGLAAYFNIQPWVVRLIFVAPILLNILFGIFNGIFFAWQRDIFPNLFIGSFSGTFVLAYIILWMVLPEAKTTYQKMEMRGETVDVNRIRQNVRDEMNRIHQNVKDEMSDIKTRAQAWSAEVKEFAGTRGKEFASDVAQTARPIGSGCGHALGVLFKAFFLLIAGSIAFGLLVALIVLVFGGGTALW
ncbi:MAG: PspC domain-containing protein, partial [Chitinophagaceae bacterium]|nr:PspC domain-containing protein [Chitinophagaceae bacterium]